MLIIVDHLIQIIVRTIFSVLREGPTNDNNDSVGVAEKKINNNFIKPKTKFWLSFNFNGDDSYFFVKGN